MYGLPKNVCVVHVVPLSVYMLLPYVLFVFCMSEIIFSFRSLRAESQVFALLMLFLCMILHTMSSGKSMQSLCILPFWYVVLVCHQYDVCKNYVVSVYIDGYGALSETRLCVSCDLFPASFLVVSECPSDLL